MTAYRRGDVVLVAMDFTDRSGSKLRPALVVSGEDYNRGTPDVLIASITGNLGAIPHPGDHRIGEWKAAGLLKPSLGADQARDGGGFDHPPQTRRVEPGRPGFVLAGAESRAGLHG